MYINIYIGKFRGVCSLISFYEKISETWYSVCVFENVFVMLLYECAKCESKITCKIKEKN